MAIRQSASSYLWGGAAASALAFIGTFGGTFWFPVTTILGLGTVGVLFSVAAPEFAGSLEEEAEPIEEDDQQIPLVLTAAAVAFGAFTFLYFVLNNISFTAGTMSVILFFGGVSLPTATQAQQVGAFVFLVITVPWAEEEFFRGFWGNLAIRYAPLGVGEALGGIIFMIFHIAVYSLFIGPHWGLILLLSASGATFIAVDEFSQDITSSIIGHSLYNGLAFGVSGSLLGFFGLTAPTGLFILPALGVLPAVMAYSLRKNIAFKGKSIVRRI